MKYTDLINLEHYEKINYFHFQNENRKYMKQYIVMKIYHSIRKSNKDNSYNSLYEPKDESLSNIWAQVNAYFGPIELEKDNRTESERMQSAYNSTKVIGYMGSVCNS